MHIKMWTPFSYKQEACLAVIKMYPVPELTLHTLSDTEPRRSAQHILHPKIIPCKHWFHDANKPSSKMT
uniref:Uncharacterized protein n=1 Tax=Rhizophora mucronata TaxID=61149 RepID=A0A2P2NIW8_RHIMU